jgi:exodeoxyribonuclease V alpha subunit
MNRRYRNLGIATVWNRNLGAGDEDGASEFRRRLRQVEAGAAELNLDAGVVHVAAEIAAMEPELNDEHRLALILLVTASLAALQEGSTRLPVAGEPARTPMRRMLSTLCGDGFGADGPDAMAGAIARLLDSEMAPHVIGRSPDDYRPLIYLPPFIYHHRVRVAELRLAQQLADRVAQTPPDDSDRLEAALADTIARPGRLRDLKLVLSAEQREAVANAAGHRLALISGGPGTGKTSIILAIVRVLVRMGVEPKRVALAAPTGKAAFRMDESISEGLERIENPADADRLLKESRPAPRTIHRLLGFSPSRGRFTYHRNNPLDAAAVIVDEGSMLDLSLMERLVGALQPEARLIVLGDADQLPSVAAGAVFRDVAAAATEAAARQDRYRGVCTRLTHSYRMDTDDPSGRAVFSLARAINSADQHVAERDNGAKSGFGWRDRPEELGFAGAEFLAGPGLMEEFLDRWYDARVRAAEVEKLYAHPIDQIGDAFDDDAQSRLERIFNHMAASRILCFTRVLSSGSERVNASLHRLRAESTGAAPERDFLPGEPVLVVRNDYERMLFNGDQGVIVRILRPGGRPAPMAVFRRLGKFVAFHLAALRASLELCYATTIHKAQGSEFDAVAVVLPERDLPILTREALYTAVTRSRRSVVMVGQEELLATGIARGIERFSGLAEELARSYTRLDN